MEVSVATPEKRIFTGKAKDVLLNSEKGQINILERHANLIAIVKPGPLLVRGSVEDHQFDVSDGVLKVEGDRLSILCSTVTIK